MPVLTFSFPVAETRLFQVGRHVYKFKIRHRSRISNREETLDNKLVSKELENAVRVVLVNLDSLHPFVTNHFYIFPCKSRWERVTELRFRRGDVKLFAYPYVITLYVEIREQALQDTANHASERVPSGRKIRSDGTQLPPLSAASEPKRRRTEHPQEGAHSPDFLHNKMEQCHLQHFHESPYLADGAEEMDCGSKLHADSEVPSQPAPGAKNPACEAAKQEVSEMSESKSTGREQSGVFTKLARIAVLPLSLLFKRN